MTTDQEHAPPASAQSWNWPLDAGAKLRDQLLKFFKTAWWITRHPRKFAQAWGDGTTRPPNPLGYFATSIGVTTSLAAWAGQHRFEGPWSWLSESLEPYIAWILLGIVSHGFLKLWARPRDIGYSVGLSLLVGGGPAAAADAIGAIVTQIASTLHTAPPGSMFERVVEYSTALGIVTANAAFLIAFPLALGGIHQTKTWKATLALVAAWIVVTILRYIYFQYTLEAA